MENHHFNGKIHYKWPFSIATLNYQRVLDVVICHDLSHCTHQRSSSRLRLDLLSISKYLRSRAWAWPQDVGIYGGKRISGAAAAVWLLSLSSQCDRCVNIWPKPDPWKTRNRFWPGCGPPFVPHHQNRWVRSPEVTSSSPPCSTAFPQVFPIGSII